MGFVESYQQTTEVPSYVAILVRYKNNQEYVIIFNYMEREDEVKGKESNVGGAYQSKRAC